MQELVKVTGIILKSVPIGEYDRRIVILTRERGKITAFVRAARKANSRFIASTNPFCFGTFSLFQGRDAYSLAEADIQNYFEELRNDFVGAYLGMYFLEVAEYYGRENNDDFELLKLLYQSLRAVTNLKLNRNLIKSVFEIKAIVVNGEFPGIPMDGNFNQASRYAVEYVVNSKIEKLYSFSLNQESLTDFENIAKILSDRCFDRKFKSLEILKDLL